jgi:hypothetical protein
MNRLWHALDTHLITHFAPSGGNELACDDTLFHEGPTMEGAGIFRDAVRSTVRRIVYARGPLHGPPDRLCPRTCSWS